MNWLRTETAARLAVVAGVCLLISGGVALRFVRGGRREPNQDASGNGAITLLFRPAYSGRAVPEQIRDNIQKRKK